jgi:16S rRNA processing protein RimM
MTGPTGPRSSKRKNSAKNSGQPRPEFRYLAIGRIVRAHGVRGEVSMTVLTEFPERFETTKQVYLGDEFEATPYTLESYRWHKDNLLLTLAGVTTRTEAEQLGNPYVQIPVEEAVPLAEGSYYLYQLIGLAVITDKGEVLGNIVDILETGANDVYVVETDQQRQL